MGTQTQVHGRCTFWFGYHSASARSRASASRAGRYPDCVVARASGARIRCLRGILPRVRCDWSTSAARIIPTFADDPAYEPFGRGKLSIATDASCCPVRLDAAAVTLQFGESALILVVADMDDSWEVGLGLLVSTNLTAPVCAHFALWNCQPSGFAVIANFSSAEVHLEWGDVVATASFAAELVALPCCSG